MLAGVNGVQVRLRSQNKEGKVNSAEAARRVSTRNGGSIADRVSMGDSRRATRSKKNMADSLSTESSEEEEETNRGRRKPTKAAVEEKEEEMAKNGREAGIIAQVKLDGDRLQAHIWWEEAASEAGAAVAPPSPPPPPPAPPPPPEPAPRRITRAAAAAAAAAAAEAAAAVAAAAVAPQAPVPVPPPPSAELRSRVLDPPKVRLFSKNGYDVSDLYPDVRIDLEQGCTREQMGPACILDGELIVVDEKERPLAWDNEKWRHNSSRPQTLQKWEAPGGGRDGVLLLDYNETEDGSGMCWEDASEAMDVPEAVRFIPRGSAARWSGASARAERNARLVERGRLRFVVFDALMIQGEVRCLVLVKAMIMHRRNTREEVLPLTQGARAAGHNCTRVCGPAGATGKCDNKGARSCSGEERRQR
jgi:hypothetical protein